jgi:purine-binding chemotaxis protein CheW
MPRRRATDQAASPRIQPTTEAEEEQPTTSYLLLRLADELYAVHSTAVREIARWRQPTPVPGAPPMLPGIINQRGVVLPVINMCALLGLSETPPGRSTRYLVAYHEDIGMALLVDMVLDLVELPDALRETVPPTLNPQQARLLHAIFRHDQQLIALLDLAEIVNVVSGEA